MLAHLCPYFLNTVFKLVDNSPCNQGAVKNIFSVLVQLVSQRHNLLCCSYIKEEGGEGREGGVFIIVSNVSGNFFFLFIFWIG